MKKNQLTKLLQNKIVLAALLMVLVAGTAAAGVIAMRQEDSQEESQEDQPGYAFETQMDSEANQEQLANSAETDSQGDLLTVLEDTAQETENQPVQSGRVDAILNPTDTSDDISLNTANGEKETLVDDGNAVIYQPENEDQQTGAQGNALNFQENSHIAWPVEGNIVLDYSMDSTVYFSTLKQYKCNPGILIQSEVGIPVEAAVRGMVTEIGTDEELGNFIQMDLGGDYSILYGQLENIQVSIDQVVEAGETLGYVAEPTKYYVVEGPNMYLEMRYQDEPIDPLDYIR